VLGLEALVRWQDPDRAVVLPAEFIPAAEESGFIAPICEWVLRTACAQNKTWQDRGLARLRITVNVSPIQLEHQFVRKVQEILSETGLDPQHLQLEVTEGVWPSDLDLIEKLLSELKEIGVQIALDNFGRGYASFAYVIRCRAICSPMRCQRMKSRSCYGRGGFWRACQLRPAPSVDSGAFAHPPLQCFCMTLYGGRCKASGR